MKPWRLQELTLSHTRSRTPDVALLPIGSTEAHGPHVPYGSDAYHSTAIADKVCEAATARGASVVLLPTLPYGVQGNTMGFSMTIGVEQTTLDQMVREIIGSLERQKVRKLVLVNGHGGNDLKPLLRSIYPSTGVFVCLVDWWKVGSDKAREIFEHPGEHADEMETSVGLALFGDLIRLPDAGDGSVHRSRFEAIEKGWVSIARPWHLVTNDSTHGDPRKATKAKGEAYVQLVVERLTDFVVELGKEKMEGRFPY
ncbi:MAG: creatininase family protein [Bacteroidetes bacterium]|jgi:creatinine amidohydrolase|nr:creatininase family protein [Bacteroidota bacterium]